MLGQTSKGNPILNQNVHVLYLSPKPWSDKRCITELLIPETGMQRKYFQRLSQMRLDKHLGRSPSLFEPKSLLKSAFQPYSSGAL